MILPAAALLGLPLLDLDQGFLPVEGSVAAVLEALQEELQSVDVEFVVVHDQDLRAARLLIRLP